MDRSLKNRIEEFIVKGMLDEANELIDVLLEKLIDELDVLLLKSCVLFYKGEYAEAEVFAEKALRVDSLSYEGLYNCGLAAIYQNKINKGRSLLSHAKDVAESEELKERCMEVLKMFDLENRDKKMVFFVKKQFNHFIDPIIEKLYEKFDIRKIYLDKLEMIDANLEWCDIAWFEWCDELIGYGSRLAIAQERTIICRLHRYEVFSGFPQKVIWENVDSLIIVTDHLEKLLNNIVPNIKERVNIVTIENGVEIDDVRYTDRKKGFNLAYVGYMHSRKNPALLLQIIKKLVMKDEKYKLFIAGQFQEELIEHYWKYQVERMGLEKNVFFDGWQSDIGKWLEDKNYILSTSVHESFGYGIAEGMTSGIKPVIHDFLYASEIWDEKYLFNTIDEAVEVVEEEYYDSKEYRDYIEKNYSAKVQMEKISFFIDECIKMKQMAQIEVVKGYFKECLKKNNNIIEELTLMIPTYNRADLLRSDLHENLVFGNQKKIIVDDCSTAQNRSILSELNQKSIEKIVFLEENKGVGHAVGVAINNVDTKFAGFVGDDDLLISFDDKNLLSDILDYHMEDNCMVIPRFVFNLCANGDLVVGSDRGKSGEISAKEMLKILALTGEMNVMIAGTIFERDNLVKSLPVDIFRVSEDFVMLTRVLSNNLEKKIRISESYCYVRRVNSHTLSKKLDSKKLKLTLIAMLIAGINSIKLKVISKEELLNAFEKRAKLLNEMYGFDLNVAEKIKNYIKREISGKRLFDELFEEDFSIPREILEY